MWLWRGRGFVGWMEGRFMGRELIEIGIVVGWEEDLFRFGKGLMGGFVGLV